MGEKPFRNQNQTYYTRITYWFCWFRLIGPLLTLSPEHCFVAEDDEGLMGYAVAALDAKELRRRETLAWIPAMREKYRKPAPSAELTPAEVSRQQLGLI